MRFEDALQLQLVLGFQQRLERSCGQLRERLISPRKHREGPAPFSVSTRSAAWSAFASVLNDPAATAVSTMSLSAVAAPILAVAPVMVMAATTGAVGGGGVGAIGLCVASSLPQATTDVARGIAIATANGRV